MQKEDPIGELVKVIKTAYAKHSDIDRFFEALAMALFIVVHIPSIGTELGKVKT